MGAAEPLTREPMDVDAFLRALGDAHTFQTFGEGKARGNRKLSRILHGTLADHAAVLSRLNESGAGVFVMVNGGNGRGRKFANVNRIRAYFVDLDGTDIDVLNSAPLPPHAVIETSPGRWHAYWWIESAPLSEFKRVQQALAKRFAADAKICDLPRVMRLPGFDHRKYAPFRVHIVNLRGAPKYAHAEFVAAFQLEIGSESEPKRYVLSDAIPEGERNNTLYRLARGFVRNGMLSEGVNVRLQRINAERCKPPLCATEIDAIAKNAYDQGSNGFTLLPHSMLDSQEWKRLPPTACAIVLAIYRQFNGSNNGRLALPWDDFVGQHNIGGNGTFYSHLKRAVNAGFLIEASKPRNTQRGRVPALFAIPDKYLVQVSKQHMGPSVESAQLNR